MEPEYHFLEALIFNEKRKQKVDPSGIFDSNKLRRALFLKTIFLEKFIPTLHSKDEVLLARKELSKIQSELYNVINIVKFDQNQLLQVIDNKKLKKLLSVEKLKKKWKSFQILSFCLAKQFLTKKQKKSPIHFLNLLKIVYLVESDLNRIIKTFLAI